MQVRAGALILSPTDLTKHLACGHVTTLTSPWRGAGWRLLLRASTRRCS